MKALICPKYISSLNPHIPFFVHGCYKQQAWLPEWHLSLPSWPSTTHSHTRKQARSKMWLREISTFWSAATVHGQAAKPRATLAWKRGSPPQGLGCWQSSCPHPPLHPHCPCPGHQCWALLRRTWQPSDVRCAPCAACGEYARSTARTFRNKK